MFKIFKFDDEDKLYHIGRMDYSKKSRHSYEGDGLSVSICPEEWQGITPLGGNLWELRKEDPKFLDVLSLTENEKDIVTNWAVDNGFVTKGYAYKYPVFVEDDEYVGMSYTFEEAVNEYCQDEEYPEEDIIKIDALIATDKLINQTYTDIDITLVFDTILALYVETVLDYDGLYWDELLDVYRLSAPRGVVFNSKINTFKAALIDDNF